MNRKILHATETVYDGIKFRSQLEKRVYIILKEEGYTPEYENDTIMLMESFRPNQTWYIDGNAQITKKGKNIIVPKKSYTPDFKLSLGSLTVYIEAKGHPNDIYPTTRKMFLKWIDEQEREIIFSEIHSIKGLRKFIEVLKQLKTDE